MRVSVLLFIVLLLSSTILLANGNQYELRVDGLSCPYCAYGVEKKLIRTNGVQSIEFDLEKGLVIVKVQEGYTLSKEQLEKLLADAGFTLRSLTVKPL